MKLFGKNICRLYFHHIMKKEYEGDRTSCPSNHFLRKIDLNQIPKEIKPIGTTISESNLRKLTRRNKSLCEGYILEVDDNPVGMIWVMFKGANDLEYRIRNIPAYIFDVYINEKDRGRGYAGEMILLLMEQLHRRGINAVYLAVSIHNASAIRAYKKAGFTTEYDKKFIRFLKINVPYHKL